MLVAVSGQPGTGTTTLSRILSSRLNLPHVYAGAIFRSMARERGMSLADFSAYAEEHHEVDMELDARMVEIAGKGHAILEGRLSAWQADRASADALKVLLTAPERVRAERVAEREGADAVARVLEENRAREASEAKRYRELYGVDPTEPGLYDLVIDTSDKPPEEVARIVLDRVEALQGEGGA